MHSEIIQIVNNCIENALFCRVLSKLNFEDLVSMFLYIHSLCGEDLYVDQRSREGFQQGLLAAITDDTIRDPAEWSTLAKHLGNIITTENSI